MKIDPNLIAARRRQAKDRSEMTRISDVARQATLIQKQAGCTRAEALRVAEKLIPHPKHI